MPAVVRRIPGQTLKAVRVVRVGAIGDLVAIEDAIAVVVGIARAGLVDVVLIAIRRAVVVRIEIVGIGAELDLDRILQPVSVRVQRIGWRGRWRLGTLVRRSRGFSLDDRRFLATRQLRRLPRRPAGSAPCGASPLAIVINDETLPGHSTSLGVGV